MDHNKGAPNSGLRGRVTGAIHRLVIGVALVLLAGKAAMSAELDDTQALTAFVDGYAKSMMASNESPAGVVAIAHDGRLVLARGYGFGDLDERTPVAAERTLFRPGSISKLFTWVSVMQQVEKGRLDLDTDVNEYLETFQIKDTWPGQPVTLRHIMTHSAGFEDGALGYLIVDDPQRIMPLAESMARYQPERVNPPGAQTAYSNYATALAGLIVANVSGTPFNEYVKRNIFDVLGMTDSTFEEPLPSPLAANMAGTYVLEGFDFALQPYEIISNFGPAGAMASTATDMMRFALTIAGGGAYEGGRILEPSTVDEMLSQQFSHDPRLPGIGLGFYASDANGYRLVGHGGDTNAFHSELFIDRTNDVAVFVSFAAGGGSLTRTLFKQAFYDEYFPRPEQLASPPENFDERAQRFAGSYRFWRHNFSTIEKALQLGPGLTVTPSGNDTLVVGFPGSAKEYAEVEKNLFREVEPLKLLGPFRPAEIAFQENEDGEITGFVMEGLPFMSTYRVSFWESTGFNALGVGLSLLAFAGVVLRFFYRRAEYKAMPSADRGARRASLMVAVANLAAVIIGVLVAASLGASLFSGIPLAFKLWLVLPVLAFLAGLYHLYQSVRVWRGALFEGKFARVLFTGVTLAALFMCWFYWYWNILGFQYKT